MKGGEKTSQQFGWQCLLIRKKRSRNHTRSTKFEKKMSGKGFFSEGARVKRTDIKTCNVRNSSSLTGDRNSFILFSYIETSLPLSLINLPVQGVVVICMNMNEYEWILIFSSVMVFPYMKSNYRYNLVQPMTSYVEVSGGCYLWQRLLLLRVFYSICQLSFPKQNHTYFLHHETS